MWCVALLMKIMLITQRCSSCCRAVFTLSQGHFSFSCCPTSRELEVHEKLEQAEPRHLTQSGQRDVLWPFGIMLNNETKGKKEEGAMGLVFLRNH